MANKTQMCYAFYMLMTVFDKSFIHGITVEEAAVFDMHFMTNLTPLFFIEVLADLEKSGMDEAARIGLVRDLASKTPSMHSYPNVPHAFLAINEMLGEMVEMRGVPVVGGARRVQSSQGLGTVIEYSQEMQAANRWQQGVFGPNEYASARQWREMLKIAPRSIEAFLGGSAERFTFRDLKAVKEYAERILDSDGSRFRTLRNAMVALGIPEKNYPDVLSRWKSAGGPKLVDFVPFSRHVLLVDMFRILAMASGLMSAEKTSNFADIAYLYYLPFCQVFISSDKLHRKCVPLFLEERQQFVWGHDLKPHLKNLTNEYLEHPELDELGLVKLSRRKRLLPGTFIGEILTRGGRPHVEQDSNLEECLTQGTKTNLVDRLMEAANSPPPDPDTDLSVGDMNTIVKRSVPRMRGRLPIMPQGSKSDGDA